MCCVLYLVVVFSGPVLFRNLFTDSRNRESVSKENCLYLTVDLDAVNLCKMYLRHCLTLWRLNKKKKLTKVLCLCCIMKWNT